MPIDNSITLPELGSNNPYFTGSVLLYDDGTLSLEPGLFIYQKSNADRYYTVIDNENLSSIAYEAYGDSKLWHVLSKANNIFDPFSLQSGLTLLIPDLNHVQIANL